jgi:TolA-binding protein
MKHSSIILLALLFIAGCSKSPSDLLTDARALQESGKKQDALALYERIAAEYKDAPEAPEALFRSAQLYHELQRDIMKATVTYELIAERYPESTFAENALFTAGFNYANEIQNLTKAREVYGRFLQRYPKSKLAPSAQAELANLGKTPEEILQSLQSNPDTAASAVSARAKAH